MFEDDKANNFFFLPFYLHSIFITFLLHLIFCSLEEFEDYFKKYSKFCSRGMFVHKCSKVMWMEWCSGEYGSAELTVGHPDLIFQHQ